MVSFKFAIALLSAAFDPISAIPTKPGDSSINSVGPLFPENTTVAYYDNALCTLDNSTKQDYLQEEYCTPICYESILIAAVPKNDCTFTIYTGSTTCNGGGEQVRYVIPAGDGQLCIDTAVLDSCKSEATSGVWSCG